VLAHLALWRGSLQGVKFGFDCRQIGVDAFFQKARLPDIALFAACAVAKALEQRNFIHQLVDVRLAYKQSWSRLPTFAISSAALLYVDVTTYLQIFLSYLFLPAPMQVDVFILQFSKLNVVLIGLANYDGQANDCEQVFDHDRYPVVCSENKQYISPEHRASEASFS